jgi:hypothetical protein
VRLLSGEYVWVPLKEWITLSRQFEREQSTTYLGTKIGNWKPIKSVYTAVANSITLQWIYIKEEEIQDYRALSKETRKTAGTRKSPDLVHRIIHQYASAGKNDRGVSNFLFDISRIICCGCCCELQLQHTHARMREFISSHRMEQGGVLIGYGAERERQDESEQECRANCFCVRVMSRMSMSQAITESNDARHFACVNVFL